MIELEPGKALEINLKADADGRDRVTVTLHPHDCAIDLTPHQARMLATELIMAVNRAEVRGTLTHSPNLARRTQPAVLKRGLLGQTFAK